MRNAKVQGCGFTLVEIMICLALAGVMMAIGAIMISSRQMTNRLYQEAKKIEADLIYAASTSLESSCPLRMIPCQTADCRPATGPVIGYALQRYCQASHQVCGVNCNLSDGYVYWDFVNRPQMIHSAFEVFGTGIAAANAEDGLPRTNSLIFNTDPISPIVFNGSVITNLDIDGDHRRVFLIGMKGKDPRAQGNPPGWVVAISLGGDVKSYRCTPPHCSGTGW